MKIYENPSAPKEQNFAEKICANLMGRK